MKRVLMGLALLSMIVMSGCSNKKSRQAAEIAEEPAVGFIRLNVPLVVEPAKAEATAALAEKLVAAAHFKKLVPAIGALCEKVNAETFYFD